MFSRGSGFDQVQDWLYVVIVASLALYFVIGLVAWIWMIFAGVATPESFTMILATIAGGLVGIVGPLRPPPGNTPDDTSGGTSQR